MLIISDSEDVVKDSPCETVAKLEGSAGVVMTLELILGVVFIMLLIVDVVGWLVDLFKESGANLTCVGFAD